MKEIHAETGKLAYANQGTAAWHPFVAEQASPGALWPVDWEAGDADKVYPSAPQAGIRHADAVVALVANRLTASCPLYRVEEWAADYAIEAVLGIAPDLVNDDRLAVALDAVAESADDIEAGMAT